MTVFLSLSLINLLAFLTIFSWQIANLNRPHNNTKCFKFAIVNKIISFFEILLDKLKKYDYNCREPLYTFKMQGSKDNLSSHL